MPFDFTEERTAPVNLLVHNGRHHADDVGAAALLALLYNDNIKTTRTRDPLLLSQPGALAVDVGNGIYDHHQSPQAQWEKYKVPHCGLSKLFTDPGVKERCRTALGLNAIGRDYLERSLVAPVCRKDNGLPADPAYPNPLTYVPAFNSTWNEPYLSDDAAFNNSVDVTKQVWKAYIRQAIARQKAEPILKRLRRNKKEIVELDRDVPNINSTLAGTPAKVAIVGAGGPDSISSAYFVPVSSNKLNVQKVLPPVSWRGKTGRELERITGVPGARFVHNNGFMMSGTNQAVRELARKVLEIERHKHE